MKTKNEWDTRDKRCTSVFNILQMRRFLNPDSIIIRPIFKEELVNFSFLRMLLQRLIVFVFTEKKLWTTLFSPHNGSK